MFPVALVRADGVSLALLGTLVIEVSFVATFMIIFYRVCVFVRTACMRTCTCVYVCAFSHVFIQIQSLLSGRHTPWFIRAGSLTQRSRWRTVRKDHCDSNAAEGRKQVSLAGWAVCNCYACGA